MKQRTSRLLSALLVLCMALALLTGTVWAASSSSYAVTGGSIHLVAAGASPWQISYCDRTVTEAIIPSGAVEIGSINPNAFSGCSSLTSVTIPYTVTHIGDRAFMDCASLTDVYFGGSESQWKEITIESGNDPLLNARFHYNITGPAKTFPDYRTVVQNIVNQYGVFSAKNYSEVNANTGIMDVFTAELTNDGKDELCVFYMDSNSDYGIKTEVYTMDNGVARMIFEYRGVSTVFSFGAYKSKTENHFLLGVSRYSGIAYVWRNGDFVTADMSKMTQKQKDYLAANSAANVGYYAESRAKDQIQMELLGLDAGNSADSFVFADTVEWDKGPTLKTLSSMGVSSSPTNVFVTVNGKAIEWSEAEPFIDANGRTMVPLRAVGDALGLAVDWDNKTREASFTNGIKTIYFPIGKTTARTGDGKSIRMDTAAVIVNGRTLTPIRVLAEYFGFTVGWDGNTRTVSITGKS